jgi:hypothetical protein
MRETQQVTLVNKIKTWRNQPMKCTKAVKETKHYKLGEIRRTDDQDADQKVASGVFQFIGKEEWKKEVRKVVEKNKEESK